MTKREFDAQMGRLAGLRFPPSVFTSHAEVLQPLDARWLEVAVTRALNEATEFPSPATLREWAEEARTRAPGPDIPVLDDEDRRTWRYCSLCDDAGWREFACGAPASARQPWLTARVCGRALCRGADKYSHAWTEPCSCAGHNPSIQHRRMVLAQSAVVREAGVMTRKRRA